MREITEDSEQKSKMLNSYFLSIFIQKNLTTIPEKFHVHKGDDNVKLRGVIIIRRDVRKDREIKNKKSLFPDKIFL